MRPTVTAATAACLASAIWAGQGRVAVVRSALGERPFDKQLVCELERRSLQVRPCDPTDTAVWRDDFDVIVLADAVTFPADAIEPMLEYLRGGGKLLALGGPPFCRLVVRDPDTGELLTREEALSRAARSDRLAPIADVASANVQAWTRSSNNMHRSFKLSVAQDGPDGRPALRVNVGPLINGWETLRVPETQGPPFPQGRTLTCFAAKGDEATPQLAVEWREKDGSRWIAVVDLATEWRRYALTPEDFTYWPDNPSEGRGGKDDRFRPENAQRLYVGVAASHTRLGSGPHTYWIADLGTGYTPAGVERARQPIIEGLSPTYKLYETDAAVRCIPPPGRPETAGLGPMTAPALLHSQIWRPRGLGMQLPGKWRFVPLVLAVDESTRMCGALASFLVNRDGPFKNAVWGYVDTSDAEFIAANRRRLLDLIGRMVARMADGCFLLCGGGGMVAYLSGEPVEAGAEIANLGKGEARVRVELTLKKTGSEHPIMAKHFDLTLGPGEVAERQCSLEDSSGLDGFYTATATLLRDGRAVDRIEHEISVMPKARPDPESFVKAHDGRFWLDGRPWTAMGVNYWPLYICGLEPDDYALGWLQPDRYDPQMVERDLRLMQQLGLRMVSIQYTRPQEARSVVDFLRRCRRHGIKVNIYLPGLSVFDSPGRFERAAELIREAHLPDSPEVMSYDMMWEPHWGDFKARGRFDADWQAWIIEQYGSLEAAERDWGCPANRVDGEVTGPTDEQLLEHGPADAMVAAYRRFADDFISRRLRDILHKLREVDPHHLVGARTGYGGTGQPWPDPDMPFALQSGACHYDFISPEGWGLSPRAGNIPAAGFITAFARMVGLGKPVFWAEFGQNILADPHAMAEEQAELYEQIYRMCCLSGANGAAAWWWPGGLRRGEESDYGIIWPDGRPRPAALTAAEWSARLQGSQGPHRPDAWIEVDIEAHPRGLSALWERHKDQYLALSAQGKHVALKTAATGTDSTNCPLVAVGGNRCNGANPPRYLNAEFDRLWVLDADGKWADAHSGDIIEVAAGRPLRIKARLTNTGEAAWVSPLASRDAGIVFLSCRVVDLGTIDIPVPGKVEPFETTELPAFSLMQEVTRETVVKFRLAAHRRTPFGEKRTVTFRPRRTD